MEGIIFIIMSLTSVREAIFNAIPVQLKVAVSVGIGFFIAFIGVQNAHIIVDGATLVSLYSFTNGIANGTFSSQGVGVILCMIGVISIVIMLIKGVKAVSYTHLDVYKRQIYDECRLKGVTSCDS